MNRLFSCCVTAAFYFSCSSNSCAEVFERDWQTPGDGLLTYDDVNRREWLDLSVSRMDQFPDPRLQNAIAEIGPGGLFEGFQWAKRNDVISLAQSAGVDTATSNALTNEMPTSQLMDLIGVTFQPSAPSLTARSHGYIDETDAHRRLGSILSINWGSNGIAANAGLRISSSDDLLSLGSTGLMLYRAVPEPSVNCIVISSLTALGIILRRTRGPSHSY